MHGLAPPSPALVGAKRAALELPDGEPELLSLLFSACPAADLLRLEVALGARRGDEWQRHPSHRQRWLEILASEAGLSLIARSATAGGTSSGGVQAINREEVPTPVSAIKAAWRQARVSRPVGDGWRCRCLREVVDSAAILACIDAEYPRGRQLVDNESGEIWGVVERLALAHAELEGCFADDAWDALLEGFLGGEQRVTAKSGPVRSPAVTVKVDGLDVEVAFEIGACVPRRSDSGLSASLSWSGFDAYYDEEAPGAARRALRDRRNDLVRVDCLLRDASGSVQRQAGCLLYYVKGSRSGSGHCKERGAFWWLDLRDNGVGHAVSLEVRTAPEDSNVSTLPHPEDGSDGSDLSGGGAFQITKGLVSAEWNLALAPDPSGWSGSELLPLILVEDLDEGPVKTLEPHIAFIRRGGERGFAQKAKAARAAGARGCVFYEGEGDREALGVVQMMTRYFCGRIHPDPCIPAVLVNAVVGKHLLSLVSGPGAGVRVRIGIDRSMRAKRRLPEDLVSLRASAARGDPVHIAVLVERVKLGGPATAIAAARGGGAPRLSWFHHQPSGALPGYWVTACGP